MAALAERLDALIDELSDADIDAEIGRCEAKLAVLRALKERRAEGGERTSPLAGGNDKPAKTGRGRAPNGAAADSHDANALAVKLGRYLKDQGPKRIDSIRNHLGIDESYKAWETILGRGWFERDHGLWELSGEGWTFFKNLGPEDDGEEKEPEDGED